MAISTATASQSRTPADGSKAGWKNSAAKYTSQMYGRYLAPRFGFSLTAIASSVGSSLIAPVAPGCHGQEAHGEGEQDGQVHGR